MRPAVIGAFSQHFRGEESWGSSGFENRIIYFALAAVHAWLYWTYLFKTDGNAVSSARSSSTTWCSVTRLQPGGGLSKALRHLCNAEVKQLDDWAGSPAITSAAPPKARQLASSSLGDFSSL